MKLLTKPNEGIKYTVIHRADGMFQAQAEFGKMTLYPTFDTLRDLNIFMTYTTKFTPGICGNVQYIEENVPYVEEF